VTRMAFSTIPLDFERLSAEEGRARVRAFLASLRRRRTVRDFAPDPVPADLIDTAIEAAATAPSGANRQPWRFVVVSDAATKRKIREAAEAEEREFYERRAPAEWLADLAPLGTDWHKPFLEIAPYLIVVFRLDYEPERLADGTARPHKNYYVQESVGIAVGLLLAACTPPASPPSPTRRAPWASSPRSWGARSTRGPTSSSPWATREGTPGCRTSRGSRWPRYVSSSDWRARGAPQGAIPPP
jgi:iodotyrosine deiodinase